VVTALAAYGADPIEIAAVLACEQSELVRRYSEEFKTGRLLMEANALTGLWRRALAGNASALIWLLNRMNRAQRTDGLGTPPPIPTTK
jgi:hypothetical protein